MRVVIPRPDVDIHDIVHTNGCQTHRMPAELDDLHQPFSEPRAISPAERRERGKRARGPVPRRSHGRYEPAPDRPDPIELLREQDTNRIPDLVPLRYQRMLQTPFTFFRGGAAIMASDLASTPRTGFTVQACGDAHLSNFGVFASPERRLVFDVNDFDETLPAPWEWDVKRLAASVEIATRWRGFREADRQAAVVATVGEYRRAMLDFAGQGDLAVWYAHLVVDEAGPRLRASAPPADRRHAEKMLTRARTRDHLDAFTKLIRDIDGQPRFISDPPLLVPIEQLFSIASAQEFEADVQRALANYHHSLTADRRHLLAGYRFAHLARKVVGIGSVGMSAWVVLMIGRDDSDPLILQLKQAQASVLERYVGPSAYANAGQRVVVGQRMMQAASDIFLGWQRITFNGVERDYYVRQLRDWKGSVDVEQMGPTGFIEYGRLCGWTLARAHARSGDRIAIAGYLGQSSTFDDAIVEFAARYAEQNEHDHQALLTAVASGRVTAASA